MDVSLDKDKIRKILVAERLSLLERALDNSSDSGTAKPANPDHGDLARMYDSRQRNLSLDSLAQEKLEHIERALQRLDEGTYGICVKCGKDIPSERLLALPYADMCVDCQSKHEKGY